MMVLPQLTPERQPRRQRRACPRCADSKRQEDVTCVVGFHTTICGRPAFRLIFTLPFSEPISWIVNIAGDRRSGRRSYYNGEAKLHRTAQFSLAIPAAEL